MQDLKVQQGQDAFADNLQIRLQESYLARFKQDPISCGHGAQYFKSAPVSLGHYITIISHLRAGNDSPQVAPPTGAPAMTVPMGFAQSSGRSPMPTGLQFLARPWDEGRLLRVAFAYEQATMFRRCVSQVTSAITLVFTSAIMSALTSMFPQSTLLSV